MTLIFGTLHMTIHIIAISVGMHTICVCMNASTEMRACTSSVVVLCTYLAYI